MDTPKDIPLRDIPFIPKQIRSYDLGIDAEGEKGNPPPNLPVKLAQILGVTSLAVIFTEVLKWALPYWIPAVPPTIAGTLGSAIATSPGTPALPSILGHFPLIKRLPKVLFPLFDFFLITGAVAYSPLGLAGKLLTFSQVPRLLSYVCGSVFFGIEGSPYMRDLTDLVVPNNRLMNVIDIPLRMVTQHLFHNILYGIMFLKNPWKMTPTPPPIEPPNPKDIIVELMGSKMASYDYMMMLWVKFGLPTVGVLITLCVIYQFWYLHSTVEYSKSLLVKGDKKIKGGQKGEQKV